ncbi:MAG: hypothetical protein Q9160_007375 [Pyrenula sp. 1 TL-2023]
MAPTTVLITGASRGLGKGLLTRYLSRPNHTVIAANRDPSASSSKDLLSLPTAPGTSLILVKVDATSPTDPAEAVKQLTTSHGIEHLDIVVANAAIAESIPTVAEVDIEAMKRHTDANVYGFVRLYQATLPLLKKSEKPVLVYVGSSAGFINEMLDLPNAAYGPTKLVGHWLAKRIHFEEPQLTVFPIHPGWVQTDMGNAGAKMFGLEKAEITLEESVNGMGKVFDAATRETHGGKMWVYDGRDVQF